MREGFAGIVAAPAWGQFMRAATAGAKPEWYQMPGDVEKVAICRLSGARATDACRHPIVEDDASSYELRDASLTAASLVSPPPAPAESSVYEDLFPIGTVPVETCWLHGSAGPTDGSAGDSGRMETPLVNDALQRGVSSPGEPAYRPSVVHSGDGTKIVIQRVVGADGVTRTIVRQVR
jgi:hypothetical protein